MPHKHTRRRSTSPTAYDLPPTSLARPLPTFTSKGVKPKPRAFKPASNQPPTNTLAQEKAYTENDTPRAFTRLMSYRPPPRSGLDDGQPPHSKKRKLSNPSSAAPPNDTPHTDPQQTAKPQILPGESMSSFSARVDAALPVRGLTAKGKKMGGGERQTKTERKMQKMQKEWRAEEERRRAKRAELDEEKEEEEGDVGVRRKGGKRSGRGKEEGEEDLWAGIAAKPLRQEERGGGGGLVGLHDVVLAPPKFGKGLGERFMSGGRGKGGGLRRQAELGEARRSVVEGYRALIRQRGREGEAVG